MRNGETPMSLATRYWLRPKGFIKSSERTSPGWMGGRVFTGERSTRCKRQPQPNPGSLEERRLFGMRLDPCGQKALNLLNGHSFTAIELSESLAHLGHELQFTSDILLGGVLGQPLQQLGDNLLCAHG